MLLGMMLAGAVAIKDPPWLPDAYAIICHPTQNTGLDWVGGQFVPHQYKFVDMLITKLPESQCLADPIQEKQQYVENLQSRGACLAVRRMGTPLPRYGRACVETYSHFRVQWEVEISCSFADLGEEIRLRPEGEFHMSSLDSTLDSDPKVVKDSNFVETGICSRIS